MHRVTWVLAPVWPVWIAGIVGFLTGCQTPTVRSSPVALPEPDITLTKLTEGFDFSVKTALLPDGGFLVTEKLTGFVRRVSPDFELQPEPLVDVAVNHFRERGLLGIATHPEFASNGYVYIYYVASDSGLDTLEEDDVSEIRVSRFRLDQGGAADDLETLITLPGLPGPYHNGGCILFGPDGKLYVSLGELNRNANVVSQLTSNPRGKILRYNDDGSIPSDNPLGDDNPIYVYGVRNSFGFAFDSQGEGLFVSDNGPRGHDKLSKALPGENLGWPLVWGVVDEWYERIGATLIGDQYRHPLWDSFGPPAVAPTAVGVIPNDLYGPGMTGRVLMGAYVLNEGVRQFTVDESTRSQSTGEGIFLDGVSAVVDLQFDSTGRIYVLTTDALYRVDPNTR